MQRDNTTRQISRCAVAYLQKAMEEGFPSQKTLASATAEVRREITQKALAMVASSTQLSEHVLFFLSVPLRVRSVVAMLVILCSRNYPSVLRCAKYYKRQALWRLHPKCKAEIRCPSQATRQKVYTIALDLLLEYENYQDKNMFISPT